MSAHSSTLPSPSSLSAPLAPPAALVAGADGGVGHALASRLAAQGWLVLAHAATPARSAEVVERLVKAGAEPLRLEAVSASFTDLDEVAWMARHIEQRHPALDLLLHTAHAGPSERRVLTANGHERTFQVNYLAPYLLTRLLTGALRNARGRVVSVSSTLHRGANLAWSDLTRARGYTPLSAYAQAALALTMFSRALAEQQPDELTAISVDPGSDDPDVVRMHRWATTPVEHSSDIIMQLSTPAMLVRNGAFYEGLLPGQVATAVEDSRARARLRLVSDRLTGLS
ncbi:MAG TPA: SDR family NAD(P)-dependent oxidoreductase [Pseudonocardia sp.]|jgi:NAD(P)-dependent dehydrogenase (short-subunit alcohol dehydrogenase family)|nr:SDR family NAD(P)-dependent oxidoreductase [Pseudonocardia sp.]